MGCGCGKSNRKFVHVAPDGTETELNSQGQAVEMVRRKGGTWKLKQ